jgi:hypothetical protein
MADKTVATATRGAAAVKVTLYGPATPERQAEAQRAAEWRAEQLDYTRPASSHAPRR